MEVDTRPPQYPHHRESWLISHELWKLADKSETLTLQISQRWWSNGRHLVLPLQ